MEGNSGDILLEKLQVLMRFASLKDLKSDAKFYLESLQSVVGLSLACIFNHRFSLLELKFLDQVNGNMFMMTEFSLDLFVSYHQLVSEARQDSPPEEASGVSCSIKSATESKKFVGQAQVAGDEKICFEVTEPEKGREHGNCHDDKPENLGLIPMADIDVQLDSNLEPNIEKQDESNCSKLVSSCSEFTPSKYLTLDSSLSDPMSVDAEVASCRTQKMHLNFCNSSSAEDLPSNLPDEGNSVLNIKCEDANSCDNSVSIIKSPNSSAVLCLDHVKDSVHADELKTDESIEEDLSSDAMEGATCSEGDFSGEKKSRWKRSGLQEVYCPFCPNKAIKYATLMSLSEHFIAQHQTTHESLSIEQFEDSSSKYNSSEFIEGQHPSLTDRRKEECMVESGERRHFDSNISAEGDDFHKEISVVPVSTNNYGENRRESTRVQVGRCKALSEDEDHLICPNCSKSFVFKKSSKRTGCRAMMFLFNHLCYKHSFCFPSFLQILQCKHCPYSTLISTNMQHHMITHRTPKCVNCSSCGKKLKQASLDKHKLICPAARKETSTFVCPECKMCLTTKGSLQSHISRIHAKKSEFLCSSCHSKFYAKSDLERHMFSHHNINISNRKLETCPHCDQKTLAGSMMRKHLKNHQQGRYTCPVCEKVFLTENRLRAHRLIHRPMDRFSCSECCYTTNKRFHLDRHNVQIHGGSVWKCEHCQYYCMTKKGLSQHYLHLHSGVDQVTERTCHVIPSRSRVARGQYSASDFLNDLKSPAETEEATSRNGGHSQNMFLINPDGEGVSPQVFTVVIPKNDDSLMDPSVLSGALGEPQGVSGAESSADAAAMPLYLTAEEDSCSNLVALSQYLAEDDGLLGERADLTGHDQSAAGEIGKSSVLLVYPSG